jgi:hypothetical protein
MSLFDKLFGGKSGGTDSADAPQNDFAKEISEMAEQFALDAQKDADGHLDFSVESLKSVDTLLEETRAFADALDDDSIQNVANSVGAYILETARRNFGGSYYWYDKLDQPILVTGLPEFEISLCAVEKVKGRIANGAEDNIPFFFDGYISALKRAKKGQRTMIV